MKKILLPLLLLSMTIIFQFGCPEPNYTGEGYQDLFTSGWDWQQEDASDIPRDVNQFDENNLPPSASVEHLLPPVGNQDNFGTCVAWAVGYNLKSALNAIDQNFTPAQLALRANQTSPSDLWMALPQAERDRNCEGTSVQVALETMVTKGARTMAEVPYDVTTRNWCEATSSGAAHNRIANYRIIANDGRIPGGRHGMRLSNFKSYLANGRPIVFSSIVGCDFMNWTGGGVMTRETRPHPQSCPQGSGGHAMALTGYDDSRRAFRVRNSHGLNAQDRGNIWIGYDFFLEEFCVWAFVAENPPLAQTAREVLTGRDLAAAAVEDRANPQSADGRDRAFTYSVQNSGALSSGEWSALYIYYNAYDAFDMGIIYENNYADLAAGARVGKNDFDAAGAHVQYRMPDVTGHYYLALIVDPNNNVAEDDEANNFYFVTAENGSPLEFEAGVMLSVPMVRGDDVSAISVAELGNLNAYTPQEIVRALRRILYNGR